MKQRWTFLKAMSNLFFYMGAKHGRGNDKGPKKCKTRRFGGIIKDPLACITSNKKFNRLPQV